MSKTPTASWSYESYNSNSDSKTPVKSTSTTV